MEQHSRRSALGLMGGIMAGGAIAALVAPALTAAVPEDNQPSTPVVGPLGERFKQSGGDFSWRPQKLDPSEVAAVAHAGFWHQGYACGYGVLYSIIGLMGERYGAPYKDFPFSMMTFGRGGIAEWGGTCGALLGAAATLALFYSRKEHEVMIHELFRWYEITAFPIYKPDPGTAKVGGPLPTNVSDSILCHISVGKWCAASKIEARSPERGERCARVTVDVALKTLEILQATMDGKFTPMLKQSEVYVGCTVKDCHGGNKKDWQHSGLLGRMDCAPCHTGSKAVLDKQRNHP